MELENSKIYQLADSVDFSSGAVVSRIVTKKETGNITLFAFDQGQGLSEHSAPFDAYVQILEGQGRIVIDKAPFDMNTGEFILMPANIPHAVFAPERFKMLLIMIKSA